MTPQPYWLQFLRIAWQRCAPTHAWATQTGILPDQYDLLFRGYWDDPARGAAQFAQQYGLTVVSVGSVRTMRAMIPPEQLAAVRADARRHPQVLEVLPDAYTVKIASETAPLSKSRHSLLNSMGSAQELCSTQDRPRLVAIAPTSVAAALRNDARVDLGAGGLTGSVHGAVETPCRRPRSTGEHEFVQQYNVYLVGEPAPLGFIAMIAPERVPAILADARVSSVDETGLATPARVRPGSRPTNSRGRKPTSRRSRMTPKGSDRSSSPGDFPAGQGDPSQ